MPLIKEIDIEAQNTYIKTIDEANDKLNEHMRFTDVSYIFLKQHCKSYGESSIVALDDSPYI